MAITAALSHCLKAKDRSGASTVLGHALSEVGPVRARLVSWMSLWVVVAAVVAVAASAAGDLDTGFGHRGTVTTSIGNYSRASALVLQPDGKLVAAGSSGADSFALARYDKNGRLDG